MLQVVNNYFDSETMMPGKTYKYQIGVPTEIGDMVGVEVEWTQSTSWWDLVKKVRLFNNMDT